MWMQLSDEGGKHDESKTNCTVRCAHRAGAGTVARRAHDSDPAAPGVKLGLANVVTMLALLFLKPRDAYAILLCRVCLAAIFAGSVTSFLFSLLGGMLALTTTWILLRWKDRTFTMFGISAAAAAMHDIGQIMAAILVMGTTDVVAYLPLLLVSAIPMGLLTGAMIQVLSAHLKAIQFM